MVDTIRLARELDKLSSKDLSLYQLEYENKKLNSTLAWVLWILGFFGFMGLHSVIFKDKSRFKMYLICWILGLLLAIFLVGFIFFLIMFVFWIIDGINLNKQIEEENKKLSFEILNSLSSHRYKPSQEQLNSMSKEDTEAKEDLPLTSEKNEDVNSSEDVSGKFKQIEALRKNSEDKE